jgi:Domain of unknown function (DUF4178)
MTNASTLSDLLDAGVRDGIQINNRRYAITAVGRSHTPDGFQTREYTLDDEDFYLVIEGRLEGKDPGACRAVLTHELGPTEVRLRPDELGRSPMAVDVLRDSDNPPAEVRYQKRRYKFHRRVDAWYEGAGRSCPRVTWDYEQGGRNLAVERWPDGEMAVYEGWTPTLSRIRVVPGSDKAPSEGAAIGVLIGIGMMIFGFILLVA